MVTTVVVAEDEALIRLDLVETLAEEGYDVVGEAADGDSALELVRALSPDVAILDIKMPGTDGLTAARQIIGERLSAVVILTAFSQRELIEQARDAGAMAYVVKPFERNDLVPAIEMAIARFADFAFAEAAASEHAERAASAEAKLEERKLLDRAKGRLMDTHGLAEADAFRFLRSAAMNGRSSMGEVAQRVLDGELKP
ncbi:MAG: response regulator [Acidimicrobiales bacterium]|nr:response regulator [Acidimicrobiales bacterium]